ncbi:hypothetical protein ASA1KI_41120 [Opitutales bacterium ASA1]|uniref:hypothetical protein n=1 Tax=Congregicoccus parvus TaxID=3081749 RepID=UPI002B317554|nr:hypothetical protein ASA1KI_41120 [Opitutales bacterium ASA1]
MAAEVVLGIALGAVFAAAWLATRPVTILDAPPKPSDTAPGRHETIYIAGRESPVRQSQWQAKRAAFLSSDEKGVELVEQDANRWLAVEFGSMDLTREWESFGVTYKGALPRFRFDGEMVQVGLVEELAVFGGSARRIVVQAIGRFEKDGVAFVFMPSTMRIGALPIPFAPLRKALAGLFVSSLRPSDEFAAAWSSVDDLRVEEGKMKLGFKRIAPVLVAEDVRGDPASESAEPVTTGGEIASVGVVDVGGSSEGTHAETIARATEESSESSPEAVVSIEAAASDGEDASEAVSAPSSEPSEPTIEDAPVAPESISIPEVASSDEERSGEEAPAESTVAEPVP